MQAILLTNDLMVASIAHGAGRRWRVAVELVADAAGALAAISGGDVGLVVVDVRVQGRQMESLVAQLRPILPAGAKIVAFGPHVHGDLLAAARAAGCDEVIPRGELDRRIDGYLAAIAQTTR